MTDERDERRARIEAIRRQRAAAGEPVVAEAGAAQPGAEATGSRRGRSGRSGGAHASRVAATGVGLAAMFGFVGVMTAAGGAVSSPEPATAQTVPIIVRIHPAPGVTAPGPAVSSVVGPAPAPSTSAPRRVVLNAQPTVRRVPVTAAPAGRTNGSR
jgi:hypothetical protein